MRLTFEALHVHWQLEATGVLGERESADRARLNYIRIVRIRRQNGCHVD